MHATGQRAACGHFHGKELPPAGVGSIDFCECGQDRTRFGWQQFALKLRTNNVVEFKNFKSKIL
jgi:hypothetical protein